jgi:hypothetical protein
MTLWFICRSFLYIVRVFIETFFFKTHVIKKKHANRLIFAKLLKETGHLEQDDSALSCDISRLEKIVYSSSCSCLTSW